jgi:hypothetical protein
MIRCVSTCLRLPCASTPLHRCSCLDRPGAGVSTDTSPLQSPWGSRPCDRRSTNGTSSGGSNRGRAAPTPLAASQATIRAPTPHSPAPAPEFYLVTERQPVTTAVPGRAAGPQNLHVLGGASVTDIRIDFELSDRCQDPPGFVFRTRAGTRPMLLTPHLLDGRPRH